MADNTQALVPYEAFRSELVARQDEIAALLPSTITKEAFVNTAIVAVKQNPMLLECDRRSLHNAVTKAAHDGLRADGREGVIIPQREDGKMTARWQPMVYGIRKRARELDDIMIDAQVVYEHDRFVRMQGDDARIEHEPAPLGTPRGKAIGCYAIFRRGNEVLHREVMDAEQIAAVRAVSKQPSGIMWSKFTDEAWRKTVVRRGAKSVPCSEKLRTAIERHDEMFDLAAEQARDVTPAALPPVRGTAIVVTWRAGEAAEHVPVREFSAKALAFIRAEAPEAVLDWAKRNTLGLREFWSHDKDSALTIKAAIEQAAARGQPKEPPPTDADGEQASMFADEAAEPEPDDLDTVIRDAIAEGSREKDPAKRRAVWDSLADMRDKMTTEQVGRLRAAFDQMDLQAGKPARKAREAA